MDIQQGNHGMMPIEDIIQPLVFAKGEKDFLATLTKIVESLEFEYYALGLCTVLNATRPQYLLRNNYPEAWKKLYASRNYIEKDPIVKHGLSSHLPIIWSESLFENERELWEEANSNGLRSGWSQSSLLNRSTTYMLTMARSSYKLSAKEMSHKASHIALLIQSVQVGCQYLYTSHLFPEMKVPLTAREVEVIIWCSEGKTSEEIGMILKITGRTVNFHISNSIVKLNVTNKTAAVVRAFKLGII